VLKVQSDCIQYLDDIVGRLRSEYNDNIQLSYTINVFKERFQDEVAGATAAIQIISNEAINYCDIPVIKETELVSVLTNPAEGPQDFYEAIRLQPDFINFPEYTVQWDSIAPFFDGEGEYDFNSQLAPEVINDRNSTTDIHYRYGDRNLIFPIGVEGTYRIELDLELTNVQGVDFTGDYIRLFDQGGGGELEQIPVPELPIDGTVVQFKWDYDINIDGALQQEIRFLWQFRDQAPAVPVGPLIGYRGSLKVIKID
jgi:hypothetical protein